MEASVADKANIDPSTGPIHGVHPKAKAAPTNNGKANYFYNFEFHSFFLI